MPLVRAQIAQQVRQGDPGRDIVVNTVYHTIADGGFNPSVDWQNHANEVRDLFAGSASGSGSTFQFYPNRQLTVKVYDMADTKPRVPKAIATHVPASWETQNLGPREIAMCLSFHCGNPGIKWQRGRIYIGPMNAGDITNQVIGSSYRDIIADLGHGLFDIGGENVAHVVWSELHQVSTVVKTYWCNDLWDVMRSREQREAARKVITP